MHVYPVQAKTPNPEAEAEKEKNRELMDKISRLETLVAQSRQPSAPTTPVPAESPQMNQMVTLLEKALTRIGDLEGKITSAPKEPKEPVAPARREKVDQTSKELFPKMVEGNEHDEADGEDDYGEEEEEEEEDDHEWVTTPSGQKVTLIQNAANSTCIYIKHI